MVLWCGDRREPGTGPGGISGGQVIQIHKVTQARIKQERPPAKRVEDILFRLHGGREPALLFPSPARDVTFPFFIGFE